MHTLKKKVTARDKYLQKTYGITQARYIKMLEMGSGVCWICKKAPKTGKNLHVDHDHKTGEVRGLLCWFCNKKLIGRHRREHWPKFAEAAAYLQSAKDWRAKVI